MHQLTVSYPGNHPETDQQIVNQVGRFSPGAFWRGDRSVLVFYFSRLTEALAAKARLEALQLPGLRAEVSNPLAP